MRLFKSSKAPALILSGLLLCSCNHPAKRDRKFSGKYIANPITYEVIINNPNPEDEWKEECLAHTNTDQLVKDIVKGVQMGRIKAYDYYDGHQLNKRELNILLEKEKIQKRVGKVQFTERWYWNSKTLELNKKVEELMLGYEIYDDNGKVKGYKASFIVKLGKDD